MSTILDIIGAMLVLGILLLAVLDLNGSMLSASYQTTFEAVTQRSLMGYSDAADTVAGLAGMLEYDISKIGYLAATKLVLADSERITYCADIDPTTAWVDSVKYYLSPAVIPGGTNPNVKCLNRVVNARPALKDQVSSFKLSYFDDTGAQMPFPILEDDLDNVRSIKVKVMVQSPARARTSNPLDTAYAAAYWEKVFSPKNLRP